MVWNILGIIAIILLILYSRSKNAVWGGFTIGLILGILVALFSGFSWGLVVKYIIVCTFLGFGAEILGELGGRRKAIDYSNATNILVEKISSDILIDIAKIVGDTVEHFKKEGRIKTSERRELFKFETTMFVFYLFRISNIFSETLKELVVNEIHKQYCDSLRKNGYNSKMIQRVVDDSNYRFKAYGEAFSKVSGDNREMLASVATRFSMFLSEKTEIVDSRDLPIILHLVKKFSHLAKEWRVKNTKVS